MPARRRAYTPEIGRREYQARIAKHPNVPRAVQRGHGPVPAHIAQKAEEGTLTRGESRRYARRLGQYQIRYNREGIATGRTARRGGARPPHRLPGTFRTRNEAILNAQRSGVPKPYLRTVKEGGVWYAFAT